MTSGLFGIGPDYQVVDVWNNNVDKEFVQIRRIAERAKYVAMDTEFPGTVARPIGDFDHKDLYTYQLMRVNVSLLKLIQVGLSFFDEKGNLIDGKVFQFNFKWDKNVDPYNESSIALLENSGIPFQQLATDGLDPIKFGELMTTSELIIVNNITWLAFHSVYDFGYLLALLTGRSIPEDPEEFQRLMKLLFNKFYDLKYLMKYVRVLSGGLKDIATKMGIKVHGQIHHAGYDSLLTGCCFFKMIEIYFDGKIRGNCENHIFSLTGSVDNGSGRGPKHTANRRSGGSVLAAGQQLGYAGVLRDDEIEEDDLGNDVDEDVRNVEPS